MVRRIISLKIRSSSAPSQNSFAPSPSSTRLPNSGPKSVRHHSTAVPSGIFLPRKVKSRESTAKTSPHTPASSQQPRPPAFAISPGRNNTAVPKKSSRSIACSCRRDIFLFSANITPHRLSAPAHWALQILACASFWKAAGAVCCLPSPYRH